MSFNRIERPRKGKFVGSVYGEKELDTLFAVVTHQKIELAVILGAFYGLRRSEIVGLKWDAIKNNNLKKIRFHDLRHSCASLLYANGVSLKEIQE